VDPKVQKAMEQVRPAPGYALVTLVRAEERERELDLPAGTEAMLDSAMVRVVTTHPGDDMLAREYTDGSIVFASLHGIAPLLGTYTYLLPLERVQGTLPAGSTATRTDLGFTAH